MCTLTWWSDAEGRYEVFFNRDETKEREAALPPRELECRGVRYLAPIDPQGGGTWLAANEAGVSVALLNWYQRSLPPESAEGWQSRGRLVLDLADVTSGNELRERVGEIDVSVFPPFRLIGFIPDRLGQMAVAGWEWADSGKLTAMMPIEMPLCSSSFETDLVIAKRRERLKRFAVRDGKIDPGSLWRFHHGAEPASPWSVRMNRPDAQTWSISRIAVNTEEVRFLYEAESLNLMTASESHESRLLRNNR